MRFGAFFKEAFTGLESDADEDIEIEQMTHDYTKRGGTVLGENKAYIPSNNMIRTTRFVFFFFFWCRAWYRTVRKNRKSGKFISYHI